MPKMKLADLKPFQSMSIVVPIDLDDGTQVMYKVGIRINLPHGEYFFYSAKHGSWTRHQPGIQQYHRMNAKPTKERKTTYRDDTDLIRRLGHCKQPFNYVKTLLNLRNKCA